VEGTVKYLLLIHFDQETWGGLSVSERQTIYGEHVQLSEQLTAKGQYLGGHPLHPPATAANVRIRNGKRLVTDGPFAETREQLGGYMLIDAKDLDEAIGIAARVPGARMGTVEVRTVREGPPTEPPES
jgi:hypothetical protein